MSQTISMEKFYEGKACVAVQWWVELSFVPEIYWGRLREFNDGSADVCFGEGTNLYGFANVASAESYLSEEEYWRFDDQDEVLRYEMWVIVVETIPPDWFLHQATPIWTDGPDSNFVYRGNRYKFH